MPCLGLWTIPLQSNPSGGVVVHGDVSFSGGAGNLQINQASQKAIINWADFSIAAGELAQFNQPGVTAAVLNRVTGGNPSEIHGALKANGNVFVINPNGILVGAGGTIDVHGLALSTLDVGNGEFLAGGDMVFKGAGEGVTNLGKINAIGGDVFLIGKTVTNSGAITARDGLVGLAAGKEVLLKANADANGERVFVRAEGSGVSGTGILNDGTIEGAAVELKAHGNMYALAINNKGSIRATGASNSGGRVFLNGAGGSVSSSGSIRVSGPSSGTGGRALIAAAYAKIDGMIRSEGGSVRVTGSDSVIVGGVIDVSSQVGTGGDVTVEGDNVSIGATASIDASGLTGGGTIRAGGGFQGADADIVNAETTTVEKGALILSDATGSGDGGTVILWADGETTFEGTAKARSLAGSGKGGFVEISGKNDLRFDGLVDASAVSGRSGTVLFDPGSVTVGNAGSTITIASINSTLDTNTNVTIATHSGDVTFLNVGTGDSRDGSVQWNTDASLGVFASGDVTFLTNARTAGAGSVNVMAGWTGDEGDAAILANDPEAAWDAYLASGSFGIDDGDGATGTGNVYINDAANTRSVEVGSRYGNTNVAGNNVEIVGGTGTSRYAHLGFRDNGQVFYFNTAGYNGVATPGDPLVAMVGVNEVTEGGHVGVHAFDSTGVRTDVFVRYADDFGSSEDGNWWWRSLDGLAGGSSGRGDYLPEMGAGSAASPADITVAARGKVDVLSGDSAGSYNSSYAQIGHGGNARNWSNVNRKDTGRDYSMNFGASSRFSSSIGRLADVFGDISVSAGLDSSLESKLAAGTVTVAGAVGTGSGDTQNNDYALIGHMGTAQTGSATGDITVEAGGAIGVNSGNGWRTIAQIGHKVGDAHADSDPVMGSGDLSDFGQTPDGKLGGGLHKQLRIFADDADYNSAALQTGDLATHIVPTTVTAPPTVAGPGYTGDVGLYAGTTAVTGSGADVDSDLEGDIRVVSETGEVTVTAFEGRSVAGRTRDLQSTYAQIGHVGSSGNLQRVTADGMITVSGIALNFSGGNQSDGYAYAQLGHGGGASNGDLSGDIFATATVGAITFASGIETVYEQAGSANYAQLGHGGYAVNGSRSGDITVTAGSDNGIGLSFTAGNNQLDYVQLGHGGMNSRSTLAGAPQGIDGDITVNSVGSIVFEGGSALDDDASDSDHNLSAHLGHGGYDSDAAVDGTNYYDDPNWAHSGDIFVTSSAGDISFSAGGNGSGADNTGRLSWTQLGHGGYSAGGDHHGNITVEATVGDISFTAGGASVDDSTDLYNYAQLGHGGTGDQGNVGKAADIISVTAGGAVSVVGGAGGQSYAMIGNGGYNVDGDHDGNVVVNVGTGGLTVEGGGGAYSFALVGNGGYHINGDVAGSTTVNATGAAVTDGVRLYAGSGDYGSATIGHGVFFNSVPGNQGLHSGAVTVNVLNGGLLLDANPSDTLNNPDTGYFSHVRVGHGGRDSDADKDGAITVSVTSGDIVLKGTDSGSTYGNAQIGHGGYGGSGGVDNTREGTIMVTATNGSLLMDGGDTSQANVQVGHGGHAPDGSNIADITVNVSGSIRLTGGDGGSAFALIGNGGRSNIGDSGGIINVTAGGAIELQGGAGGASAAQIGHGGQTTVGNLSGAVTVTAGTGGISLTGGTGSTSLAQIGSGGYDLEGSASGITTVNATGTAAGDGIRLLGGNAHYAGATIGHGSYFSAAADLSDDIFVNVIEGGLSLSGAASGYFSHAMIGHGGRDVSGSKSGNIEVKVASGEISVSAGGAGENYASAQIGHGGYGNAVVGDSSGDISITATDGGFSLSGGSSYGSYAQVGHGGFGGGAGIAGDMSGSISVVADSNIKVSAGSTSYTFGRIGHGGRLVVGDHGLAGEQISVISTDGNLDLLAGAGTDSIAQIGHGENDDGSGTRQGDILIDIANGEISLDPNPSLVAWIGHRTTTSGGISDSDVTIRASGLDAVAGDSGSGLFHFDTALDTMVTANVAAGYVSLIDLGGTGMWVDSDIKFSSSYDLNLLSSSNIYVAGDILNTSTGDINLVGGWDASVADLSPAVEVAPFRNYFIREIDMDAEIFDVSNSYGVSDGSVWVGANADLSGADRSTVVGSNFGQTNVAAHDVHVWGGAVTGGISSGNRKYSQIGYNRREAGSAASSSVSGRVRVDAENDIEVEANKFAVGTVGYGGWTGFDQTGYASYAQIGHGGDRDAVRNMDLSGSIIVNAGNDLTIEGGQTRENYAMIGHGGYDNLNSTTATIGGEISVTVGNDVELTGGAGQYAAAQIGHGGTRHPLSGFTESAITVEAGGDILLNGGPGGASNSNYAYAKIGHGGNAAGLLTAATGGGYSGAINVHSDGEVVLTSGSAGIIGGFTQIGHGGYNVAGDHSGVICVIGVDGVTLDAVSSTGDNGFSQIGHGGEIAAGNFSGDVTVSSPNGAVLLSAGASTERYAQVGHGGTNAGGDMEGDINVIAGGGDLSLTGGSGTGSYAMVGHGADAATSVGTREGGVHLFASGALTATDGGGADSGAGIFHQTGGGLASGDYLGGDGFQVVGNGGITLSDGSLTDVQTMINGNLASGPISLAFSNDVDITLDGADVIKNDADDFYLLTGGDITVLSSYQQAGSGNVILVAGWNGSGFTSTGSVAYSGTAPDFNYCDPVITEGGAMDAIDFNCDTLGDNGSVLTIGSATQTDAVRVGSAGGTTTAAGYGVELLGGSGAAAATQIGFYQGAPGQNPVGSIDVRAKGGGVTLDSGTGAGAYTQIGHGGTGSLDGATIAASVTVSFCEPGDLNMFAESTSAGSYSQIGHGGVGLFGTFSGDVKIDGARNVTVNGGGDQGYAQIGHGGASGTHGIDASGDPTFLTERSLTATGAIDVINTTGAVSLNGGAGTENAYSQVGHGGVAIGWGSTIGGAVAVEAATGGVQMQGGDGSTAYTLIGHGGYQISSAITGDIKVDAKGTAVGDGIVMNGGDGNHSYDASRSGYSGAMIGSGGYSVKGDVGGNTTVTVQNGDLEMYAGDGYFGNTSIGHTGMGSSGNYTGSINVLLKSGDVLMEAGSAEWFSFAQIGHGGWDNRNHSGNVSVVSDTGNITIRSGNGSSFNYAKIGHGGYGNGATQVNSGIIEVEATTGNVKLDSRDGTYAFTQIGHGGLGRGGYMSGEYHDNVSVTAGKAVEVQAGGSLNTFSMIGHGGTNARGIITGAVTVNSGAEGLKVAGDGGDHAMAQVGHGGFNEAGVIGVYDIATTANVSFTGGKLDVMAGSGDTAYAMFGNGGYDISGVVGGNIQVTTTGTVAADGITLTGGADYGFAMIGKGGMEGAIDTTGNINVTSAGGGISLKGGATSGFAMIGNGGHQLDGALGGNTTVTSNGGTANDGVSLQGGGGTYAFANIGNASNNATGSMTSNTTVNVAGGGLTLKGGTGPLTHAAIGMQARGYDGNRVGLVDVNVDSGDVMLVAGDGVAGQAHIGHGGFGHTGVGAIDGAVDVTVSDGSLSLEGGDVGNNSYVMIGNGGASTHTGDISGSVTVDVKNAITLTSGDGNFGSAQIGLGGSNYSGNLGGATDHVSVTSQSSGVTLQTGAGAYSFSMIGMGGYLSVGDKQGDVIVNTVDGVSMNSVPGGGNNSFTQIGHGGYGGDASGGGSIGGNVTVRGAGAGSAISLSGGDGNVHYAQIGHGGYSASGTKTGVITVEAASGGVTMQGGGQSGGNSHSFAQIGHGGTESSNGAADGAINVTTTNGGDVTVYGGGMKHSHAQIGHGGRTSANGGAQEGIINVTSDGKVELKGSVNRVSGGTTTEANETYAQIGHGGMFNNTTYAGAIDVQAKTGVLVESGASHYNRAQIGHGGYSAGSDAGNAVEMVNATITVDTVTGGVIVDASKAVNRHYAGAQIGHGGTGNYDATRSGAFRGDIFVDGGTGNVELHSGNKAGASAQIGNGGTGLSGDHSGAIEISADGDLLMDLASGGTDNRFSRIGHGGIGSNTSANMLAMSGNMSGDICVHVGGKIDMSALGGTTEDAYVQIGHGGSSVLGDFDGEITVVARGADGLSLTAGSGAGAYAHIGHGGRNTAGTMTGHIDVIAETGDMNLAGGTGADAYAMLGHGDGSKTSTGLRGGGVHLFAQGDLVGTGGTGAMNEGNVYIFHQNNNGLLGADYIDGSGNGYQKVVDGNTLLSAYSTLHEGTMINENLGTGVINVLDNSATDYTIDASNIGTSMLNSSEDFQIITGGNITMLTSFQNAGTGSVTLVAGWDGDIAGGLQNPGSVSYGSPVDFCSPVISAGGFAVDFNNCSSFGNNGKTITIGSAAQNARVSVGTVGGTNTFAAAGIEMFGSDGTANAGSQLGFFSDGTQARGSIDVHVKELGLTLNSGLAEGAFTQIGHGGTGSDATGGVNASIEISFCAPGDLTLNANNDVAAIGSYAQIGHGGNDWDGDKLGPITIDGARNVMLNAGAENSYAQIGNGGAGIAGAYGSEVAGGDIQLVNTTGKVGLYGGDGLDATAQIGHGGLAMHGAMSGSVTVESGTGGIEMKGGDGERSYTMIGNGGYNVDSLVEGDVTVTAKGTAATDGITMAGGDGDYSGSFIGNSGYQNTGTFNGFTKVDVTNGGIDMLGGGGQYAGAGIGHNNRSGTGTMDGAIDVTVTEGDIELKGNDTVSGYFSHARIGHGGWDSGDKSGAINVTATDGDILVQGSQADISTLRYNFAQIGHGGYGNGANQNIDGVINVIATTGGLIVEGGKSGTSFAQVGHGGLGRNSFLAGSFSGDVTVDVAGDVKVKGGTREDSFAQIGNGGRGLRGPVDGDVKVLADGAVSIKGGSFENAHAMIGNGGSNVEGTVDGDVLVEAGTGGIDLKGGSADYTYALIGNGGDANGSDISGSTTVRALGTAADPVGLLPDDGIRLKGGDGNQSVAQIGHHHSYGTGALTGVVDVSAVAGDIAVEAGDAGYFAHAMIGHGGRDSDGDKSGTVDVVADNGDITLRAGGNQAGSQYSHAQIGHGGYANGVIGRTYSDNITVESKLGSITVTGGDASYDYAQIGHGGTGASTGMSVEFSGLVDVKAAEDVVLQGGTASTAYAQIGHGGRRISGAAQSSVGGAVNASAINVNAGRDVLVKAGSDNYTSAKIGHGNNQQEMSSFVENSVTVDAGRNVELISPQFASYAGVSYSSTQIGHGGQTATVLGGTGGYSGDILLNAGGKLDILAAKNAGTYNFSLVGHTSYYNVIGNHSGDINVTTGTEAGLIDYGITLASGTRTDAVTTANSYYSFAAIGHRGHNHSTGGGDLSGDIKVTAERGGLTLTGSSNAGTGDARLHSAQIGHGGYNADGLKSGAITVCIEDSILLQNGDSRQSPVMIGHGGYLHGGDISDSIQVTSNSGSITLDSSAGDSDFSNTQIGHGGPSSSGTLSGDVSVTASANVALTGGGANGTHAIIGHGGDGSSGTFSGDIGLIAGGNLTVTGGTHADAFGMVGHGSAAVDTTGTRSGEIKLAVGGATKLTDNTSGVMLEHGTTTAGGVSDSEFVLVTGTLDTTNNVLGVSGIVDLMGKSGDVSFAVLAGDLTIDGAGAFNTTAFQSNFVASGAINAVASIQNGGTGQVNLAGGWASLVGYDAGTNEFDGSNGLTLDIDFTNCPMIASLEFDFSTVEADTALWGASGGMVSVGSADQAVSIGSAGGTTNIFGEGFTVQGSDTNPNAYTQIGYFGTGSDMSGAINLLGVGGGLNLQGGDASGAFAQVGHGGLHAVDAAVVDSNIKVSFSEVSVVTVAGGDGDSAYAQVGHGGMSFAGDLSGNVELNAASVLVEGGGGQSASARIGNGGSRGSGDIDGDVSVVATVGNVEIKGGSGVFAEAAIGAGGIQYDANSITSSTTLSSPLDVILLGGTGIQASAQIGAGGLESTVDAIAGDVSVSAGNDIRLTGGSLLRGYSQVGNGGATANGNFSGKINVSSGNDITLLSVNGDLGAYAKIGHGDDLFSTATTIDALSGSGNREGDIEVSASANVSLFDGMIGHVNDASDTSSAGASATGGSTQIAVSTSDSTDPLMGSITADSDSEFNGADQVRIYTPERSSNVVQAGALINGESFVGAEVDPSVTKRDDEFTVSVTGIQNVALNEHSNTMGTGSAPVNTASFAFYYNSIELTDVLEEVPDDGSTTVDSNSVGGGTEDGSDGFGVRNTVAGSPFTLAEFLDMSPEDKTQSEWQRENDGLFTGFNTFGMIFEGYDHYDENGSPVYHFIFSNNLDSKLRIEVGYEDVLSVQERFLEEDEQSEEEEE